jgi:hypothetical protein
VNIEGGEYDLFDRLIESDWISPHGQSVIQFHEWHRMLTAADVHQTCAFTGLTRSVNYPFVWELWRTRNRLARRSPA